MSQAKRITLFAAGAFWFLSSGAAAAQDNVTERLAFIEERLAQRDNHANVWTDAWVLGFTAVTAGQVIAYELSSTREMQNEYRVGAITASLGIFSALTTPNPRGNSHLLDAYPAATTAERAAKLVRAERLLHSTAKGERKSRAWWNNALNFTVSTASAMVLGLYYDQPDKAGLRWASGLAVTQLRYWTQPTQAIRAVEEYERRFGPGSATTLVRPQWRVVAGPQLTGISVSF